MIALVVVGVIVMICVIGLAIGNRPASNDDDMPRQQEPSNCAAIGLIKSLIDHPEDWERDENIPQYDSFSGTSGRYLKHKDTGYSLSVECSHSHLSHFKYVYCQGIEFNESDKAKIMQIVFDSGVFDTQREKDRHAESVRHMLELTNKQIMAEKFFCSIANTTNK